MPLILLGLIVVIGIVLYGLVQYGRSEDTDTRPVRERYSHVFEKIEKIKKDGANYTILDDDEDASEDPGDSGQTSGSGHTMHFPDDAEVEKRKRNIH